MTRNRLWTIACTYFIVTLVVSAWSAPGALALLIIGGCVGLFVIFRTRTDHGSSQNANTCENCGALLQGHAGLPVRRCRNCGQQQSWVK
jgi:hypothetical protein